MTFDDAQSSQSLQIGVEICLDHRLKRLRRTVGMTVANGAAADNPMLDLQLIPSGGMQILEQSVAAGVRGAMFNSDGSDPILDQYKSSGKPVIKCSGTYKGLAGGTYVSCAQSMVNSNGQNYFSHSQLAFRHGDDVVSGYNNALGTSNKIAATYDTESGKNPLLDDYLPPRILAVTDVGSYHLYAAGTGELHEYIHKSND